MSLIKDFLGEVVSMKHWYLRTAKSVNMCSSFISLNWLMLTNFDKIRYVCMYGALSIHFFRYFFSYLEGYILRRLKNFEIYNQKSDYIQKAVESFSQLEDSQITRCPSESKKNPFQISWFVYLSLVVIDVIDITPFNCRKIAACCKLQQHSKINKHSDSSDGNLSDFSRETNISEICWEECVTSRFLRIVVAPEQDGRPRYP